jgi:hypothetical protein
LSVKRKNSVVARFRFIEAQAHLWERHQRLCAFVADVKGRLGEERWTEKERATGQAWVTCAENYLASRDPTALLFFNPLLAEDGPLFSNYRYTMPAWGPPADTWLATWEPRVPAHTDTRDALALQLAATPKLPFPGSSAVKPQSRVRFWVDPARIEARPHAKVMVARPNSRGPAQLLLSGSRRIR